jgi:uncharacterized delta-60 repeat protein
VNTNGALDAGFNPGADGTVSCLALQANGQILVGGAFTTLGGQTRNRIARLNSNGMADTSFNPSADAPVISIAVQADGKILVGGAFTNLSGQPCHGIGRLNTDGSADPTFNPGVGGYVSSLALQTDGRILVGGSFQQLAGQQRNNIGRLNNTDPATQSLSRNGPILTWLRSGTSPEVWRTSFEFSTNGTSWTALGDGSRIAGGWQLSGVLVSTNTAIRARGFIANGSSWFVETILQPTLQTRPMILTDDGNFGLRSNQFGFNVQAATGLAVVIEASTNFLNWVPIQTNLVTGSGLFLFNDRMPGGSPAASTAPEFTKTPCRRRASAPATVPPASGRVASDSTSLGSPDKPSSSRPRPTS